MTDDEITTAQLKLRPLVARQRAPYAYSAKRQTEIDLLATVYDLFRAFDDARHET